jgi:UDP-glucose 4-epimerase
MNILVTGGAGFIGSNTIDVLNTQGHNITVIDNLSTGDILNLISVINIHTNNSFFSDDITNLKSMEKIFKEGKFDAVYHFAAHMNVRESVENPIEDANTNIIGSLNILECCRKYGVKKVIFSSSGGTVYGKADLLPTPVSYLDKKPICPYGIAKLTIENYMNYYRNTYGIETIILRYGNVYGERQNPKSEAGVVSIFLKQMFNGVNPVIFGNGKQTRDYIYISDVVKVNVDMLDTDIEEQSYSIGYDESNIFNVGTGVETSVNQLFDILNEFFDNKYIKIYNDAKIGELERSCLNSYEMHRLLKFYPNEMKSIKDGLKQLHNNINKFKF